MALNDIDWFADSVSLTLNGRKSHQTRTGGCLTLMLIITVLGYWIWSTINCFTYYDPIVFTDNMPPSKTPQTNLNITMGAAISVQGNVIPDLFQYVSIVYLNTATDTFYNSTIQTVEGTEMFVPDTTECSNSLACEAIIGYCSML